MDTVTYPSDVVQQECASHWLTLKVDVSVRGDLTSTCGVHGIPASLFLAGNLESILSNRIN